MTLKLCEHGFPPTPPLPRGGGRRDGSYATGEAKPESDVDLFVVGRITLAELLEKIAPLQERLDIEINPVVMTEQEYQERCAANEHFVSAVRASETIPLVRDLYM